MRISDWSSDVCSSDLPSMASGFFGIALARWAGAPRHIRRLAFAGAILVLAGLLAATIVPINKNFWTASFVLVTSGLGALAFAVAIAACPLIQHYNWASLFIAVGQGKMTR